MSPPGTLQMFSPENGVCNNLALEKISSMSIVWFFAFPPPEFMRFVCYLLKTNGGGAMCTPGTPPSILGILVALFGSEEMGGSAG